MNSTIKEGCPICKGDVKGSKKAKFYCKKCNILYSYESLYASGKVKSEDKKVKLVGSKNSNKFHKDICIGVRNLKSENKVFFADEKEAKKKGYVACAKCYPK